MRKILLFSLFFIGISISNNAFAQAEGGKTPLVKKKTVQKKKTPTSKSAKATTSTGASSQSVPTPTKSPSNLPKMTFPIKSKDFGKVKTGESPSFTYEFTNTGDAPLEIDIVSGCDCTDLDYTRGVVPPNGKGFVKATYNTKKEEAHEHKKQLKKNIDIVLKQRHPNGMSIFESVSFDVFIVD
jgi:hypothetical protein